MPPYNEIVSNIIKNIHSYLFKFALTHFHYYLIASIYFSLKIKFLVWNLKDILEKCCVRLWKLVNITLNNFLYFNNRVLVRVIYYLYDSLRRTHFLVNRLGGGVVPYGSKVHPIYLLFMFPFWQEIWKIKFMELNGEYFQHFITRQLSNFEN